MTRRHTEVPDTDTARRAAKDSVRDAIGKLIGDDMPATTAGDTPRRERSPKR